MSEIKRYDCDGCLESGQRMPEHPDGDWIKYADHVAEIAELTEAEQLARDMMADAISMTIRQADRIAALEAAIAKAAKLFPLAGEES